MQRLIYNPADHPSFALHWLRPLIEPYYELTVYDPDAAYDPYCDFPLVTYASRVSNTWYQALVHKGHRLVVDHLWDSDVAITPRRVHNEIELRCPNFMWYLASVEFDFHGYRTYTPNRIHQHSFLMLMNNPRWHRDALLSLLHNVLPTALYSYNARDIHIAQDKAPGDLTPWQRYMNPDWYNTSAFSLVAESYMRNTIDGGEMITEVSEKIFKPLAYYHPFLVAGSQSTLAYLEAQGFETFDTWFDQSYDTVADDRTRLALVCNQADLAVQRWRRHEIGWDAETIRRTQHNHDHFFDHTLVKNRFTSEIIHPLQEFTCEH